VLELHPLRRCEKHLVLGQQEPLLICPSKVHTWITRETI
jgi:hypothetical protein